jgi:hypothetical protein
MRISYADLTLANMSPYSQSKKHDEPKLKGELADAYNLRTWKSHLHVSPDGYVLIPEASLLQGLVAAAKYSKKQIPGQGKATWTAKFTGGLSLHGEIKTNVKAEDVDHIDIFANADGIRGSGKRVMRRYPIINEWQATARILILDPIITQDIFEEIVTIAGLFIGLGRYRPEKGGQNGRFKIAAIDWQDNRSLEEAAQIRKMAA